MIGITASTVLVGMLAGLQFSAVNQSVLTLPVHVTREIAGHVILPGVTMASGSLS